jgi:hypothetical protein
MPSKKTSVARKITVSNGVARATFKPEKWYVVSYFDKRNEHTYKQPVKARTKEQAKSKVLGGAARFMKKITVSVMR